MKKQMSENGKKLSKKELRTIAGGVKLCMRGSVCIQFGLSCFEPECKSGTGGSLQCTDIVNNCVVFSIECNEPKCRFDTGNPF